jgi:hypothetical protein
MSKTNQIWYLYSNDIKYLKNECYKMLQELYIQLGQNPEAEIVVNLTRIFVNDLAESYSSMELNEVRFAINKHIRDKDGPHFINVPMWNQALRDYKKTKALKKQTNQIDQYELYKKRVESFNKVIDKREIKKISNDKSRY